MEFLFVYIVALTFKFFFCKIGPILLHSVSLVPQLCLTLCDLWTAAHQASLSITKSWSLLELMSVESVMPSNHLILCRPLLLLPSVFPNIRIFSSDSALRIRGPEDWSFSFSISPPSEYSELISFRIRGSVLQSKGLSRIFSSTTIQKRQFFGAYFPEYSSTFRQ